MNSLCYWEIPSTDIKRSAEFYARLFGWKMSESGENYIMFDVEDGIGGGIYKVSEMPEPAIDVYIKVADIPATLKRVEELGGKIERPKTEIGNEFGYYAFFRDPCGCRIGIWAKE
ncbi:VOC family protein [candidate division WOR-3 bacterium]|nr:VOC family protein [candidate division WOR-3 bacterium]